ncbi:unnamed protein product [Brassicogethes aeneus]|uniref:DUF4371 domain-containing protein n=1 Tax=Brassicogethes aeneus TaxID=1431903 RepID=A0A9P0FFG7_BRAAE|nr:unnamed protein product [Brassicogethes aeneus]
MTIRVINCRSPMPKNLKSPSKKQAWESQYKWLKPIAGNSFAATCTTCCDALAKTTKTQPKIIDLVKETVLEKKIKRAEVLVCAFLAEHNVPFLAWDHLIPILQKCFSDSAIAKSMSVARTKATGIVKNFIARNEFENLVQDLKTSKFSLLVDESTDVGTTKNMAVCVRYYSEEEKSINTKFLTLLQVFSKNNHQETFKEVSVNMVLAKQQRLHVINDTERVYNIIYI